MIRISYGQDVSETDLQVFFEGVGVGTSKRRRRSRLDSADDSAIVPSLALFDCSLDEMRRLVAQRYTRSEKSKREVQSLTKLLKCRHTSCNTSAAWVKERDAHITALSTQTRFRFGRNVSVFGSYNLALARYRGHFCSALTAALVEGGEHQGHFTA